MYSPKQPCRGTGYETYPILITEDSVTSHYTGLVCTTVFALDDVDDVDDAR